MRAVLLRAVEGTVEEAEVPVHAEQFNERLNQALSGMRRLVGGHIEVVRARGLIHLSNLGDMPRAVLVVDEESALKELPVLNRRATALYGDAIFGDALVLAEAMVMDDDGVAEPDLVGLEELPTPEGGWVEHLTALTATRGR